MEIKRYFALIIRWAWLIVLGSVVAGAATYFVSSNTEEIYSSTARFLIDEAPGSNNNAYAEALLEQQLTQTYVDLISIRSVREETIKRLGLDLSEGELNGKLSFSAPPEGRIIAVTVEDTDPHRAALIANTLGEVFIEENQEREGSRYIVQITNWQVDLQQIGDEIEGIETTINEFGEPTEASAQAELSRLETQLNEAQVRYTDRFNNLNNLQIDQAKESNNIILIEDALPRLNPIRPRVEQNTILATVVGALIALGIIFLIEFLDDTIKTPDHIMEDTSLSIMGAIAYIQGNTPSEHLITQKKPRSPVSEMYRVIRTNLNFANVDGPLRSLVVSSANPGEGKSTTTSNLAVVLSQTGKRIILVDADLRRPTQHKIFELSNNQGLTTAILDNETAISYHIQQTPVPNLRVLTSGPIPPNPAELLNSQRMVHILDALKQEADVVIFDSPPILSVADTTILSPQMDGCVLVVETGKTRRGAFAEAAVRLVKANVNIFGAVLNRAQPGKQGYYYDYYQYQSHYEYGRKSTRASAPGIKLPRWLSGLSKQR